MRDLFFSHCLIMGRSQNWPDLRSPRSKIRDIRFVAIDVLMISWKLYIDRPRTVFTVASQIFSGGRVRLTWPGDLTWGDPGIKFSEMVRNWWLIRYAKNGGTKRRRFFAIREKPHGGVPPPPAGRGLRFGCLLWVCPVQTMKLDGKVRFVLKANHTRACNMWTTHWWK